ncbi:ABC transporter ATP-binding protein [Bacillus alkalicellulosilyticus]|uniref:ABC transporter ATP-binding protein n=1 Tax=Alkalihalobacterium alkalicellulosilyticum TaxID=1912214 RepID=UPI0009969445|nr:ABC transporter ATP-binding protein [Bacillus alkalicellulosilyticus]
MLALIKYLKPYRMQIIAVLVFTLGAILLELYLPTLMADVVDIGIVNEDIPFILQTGGWMIIYSILAVLLTIAVTYFASKIALGFGRDLRRKLFVHVENFSLEEYEKIGPASLITRTTNDIKQIQDVLNMMLRMMTRAPLMLVGGIILAVSRDAMLSLIFLGALPVLAGIIFFISKKAIPLFGVLQQKTDRLNLILRESLIGVRVIRAFNRVSFEKNRFNEANHDYRDVGIKVNKIIAFLFPVMLLIMNFTNVAIVWFGSIRIDAGAMQVGNLMAFLQYAMMILMSLVMLSMAFVMIPRAQASAKRVNEIILQQPNIKDSEQPVSLEYINGTVSFKNVTFHYTGAEKPALEEISFTAKPGNITAIIGSTGAGKSTLAKLIPRFYDTTSGSVEIGGNDIRTISQKELRQLIGYVPQKASLFTGTIAENIRYGKDDATDDDILLAIEKAQATEFVIDRENGIHSAIEQAGVNLSGGQKQRLSIARAFVRQPKIYIFDDSTSALDYKTEAKMRKVIEKEAKESTFILIAQRIQSIIHADQIIVLNEGKIAGVGTHDELVKTNAVYQEIYQSQKTEGESA